MQQRDRLITRTNRLMLNRNRLITRPIRPMQHCKRRYNRMLTDSNKKG